MDPVLPPTSAHDRKKPGTPANRCSFPTGVIHGGGEGGPADSLRPTPPPPQVPRAVGRRHGRRVVGAAGGRRPRAGGLLRRAVHVHVRPGRARAPLRGGRGGRGAAAAAAGAGPVPAGVRAAARFRAIRRALLPGPLQAAGRGVQGRLASGRVSRRRGRPRRRAGPRLRRLELTGPRRQVRADPHPGRAAHGAEDGARGGQAGGVPAGLRAGGVRRQDAAPAVPGRPAAADELHGGGHGGGGGRGGRGERGGEPAGVLRARDRPLDGRAREARRAAEEAAGQGRRRADGHRRAFARSGAATRAAGRARPPGPGESLDRTRAAGCGVPFPVD